MAGLARSSEDLFCRYVPPSLGFVLGCVVRIPCLRDQHNIFPRGTQQFFPESMVGFLQQLLTPPINKLALLLAARAPGENAENAQDEGAQGPRMPEQRKITAAIMKEWGPHKDLRARGAPRHRGRDMHKRQFTQTFPCISRTVTGQPGHSLLQEAMPDDEELDCAASKRKVLNWTPLAWLNSLSHHTGFSTSVDFNKAKVMQDWTAWNCQQLGLPIPHLITFRHDACTCKHFAIDELGDHLHC